MVQTVKELLDEFLSDKEVTYHDAFMYQQKMLKIKELYENEIAEKDKEIMELKNWIQNGGCHQHTQSKIDKLKEIK